MSDRCLAVQGLRAGYGQMEVVSGVDLQLVPGEVVCLLGRNGAGKSTTLAAMAGVRTGWWKGDVLIDGKDVTGLTTAKVAAAGIALVPEGRRVFREMTVDENLNVGAYMRRREPPSEVNADKAKVIELFPALERFAAKRAGSLSGGEQQMVAVGQALMARPRYLLLDEPTSGLAPSICEELYKAIGKLAAEGELGVLVVEQSVERALRHTHRVYVMEGGRIVIDDTTAALGSGEAVNQVVMGTT
jgi:branched-chain amino acid transport system ATP-binding protein